MNNHHCMRDGFRIALAPVLIALLILSASAPLARAQTALEFDIVLANGRVLDPESNTDAVRCVGIRNGKIASISTRPLRGRTVVDVKGLVVVCDNSSA